MSEEWMNEIPESHAKLIQDATQVFNSKECKSTVRAYRTKNRVTISVKTSAAKDIGLLPGRRVSLVLLPSGEFALALSTVGNKLYTQARGTHTTVGISGITLVNNISPVEGFISESIVRFPVGSFTIL